MWRGRVRRRSSGLNGVRQIRGVVDCPHALAATASHGLDEQRIADRPGNARDRPVVHIGAQRVLDARHDHHSRASGRGPGGRLASHDLDRMSARPDKGQAGVANGGRKFLVLREKAVARMNGVRA